MSYDSRIDKWVARIKRDKGHASDEFFPGSITQNCNSKEEADNTTIQLQALYDSFLLKGKVSVLTQKTSTEVDLYIERVPEHTALTLLLCAFSQTPKAHAEASGALEKKRGQPPLNQVHNFPNEFWLSEIFLCYTLLHHYSVLSHRLLPKLMPGLPELPELPEPPGLPRREAGLL
jgi:hypothetical protein